MPRTASIFFTALPFLMSTAAFGADYCMNGNVAFICGVGAQRLTTTDEELDTVAGICFDHALTEGLGIIIWGQNDNEMQFEPEWKVECTKIMTKFRRALADKERQAVSEHEKLLRERDKENMNTLRSYLKDRP